MEIRKINEDEIEAIANLIYELNSKSERNIGYIGKNLDSIIRDLHEIYNDEESTIFVYVMNERVRGCIAADCNRENGIVEMIGPFANVAGKDKEMMLQLIKTVKEAYPDCIYYFFINSNNKLIKELIEAQGGVYRSCEYIMELHPAKFVEESHWHVVPYQREMENSFVALHDCIFPETYYSGATILKRITNSDNKLFVISRNNTVEGYIYFENGLEPSIEYIGVSENIRQKGYGVSLLSRAIKHILHTNGEQAIKICVSSKNKHALGLYKKIGFCIIDEQDFYMIKQS